MTIIVSDGAAADVTVQYFTWGVLKRSISEDGPSRATNRNFILDDSIHAVKGGIKLTNIESEEEAEEFVKHADAQIDMLNNRLRDLGPELKQQCEDEISNLILSREAVRRGLLRVTDYGESCSSCPIAEG